MIELNSPSHFIFTVTCNLFHGHAKFPSNKEWVMILRGRNLKHESEAEEHDCYIMSTQQYLMV